MSFAYKARRDQSIFLATSPTFSEPARGVEGAVHRHLLTRGYEIQNIYPLIRVAAQEFFQLRAIKWWKSPRSGDDVASPGPTGNLVSSQIACVNFLLPLISVPEALTAMLQTLDDDIVGVVPMEYEMPTTGARCSSLIEFEWVGMRSTLEGAAATRGANVTSVDAVVVGVTTVGRRRAYLFEWKYAEIYPSDDFKGIGASGDKRRARYSGLYAAADSPFSRAVHMDAMLYEPFYQLMRLGLLGAKMVRDGEFGIEEARVVVACPSANAGYRNRVTSPDLRSRFPDGTVESTMRELVRAPNSFRLVDHSALAAGVRSTNGAIIDEWYEYNSNRYAW